MWIFLFFLAGGIFGVMVMAVVAASGRSDLEMEAAAMAATLARKKPQ